MIGWRWPPGGGGSCDCPARYLASRAVLVAAVMLAACAVAFGVWATLTKNSGTFGRQTGLTGVYSLVLAVVVAATAMIGWAVRRRSLGSSPASNKGAV